MNVLKIRKSGKFYSTFDDDCYIIYYFLNYKIVNRKVGFPESALSKVLNVFEDNKISYELVGENEKKDFKKLNKYNHYLKLGQEKYYRDIKYANILNDIRKLSSEQLEKILTYIEGVINE